MQEDTSASQRFAALQYPDFRLLWIGQLISNIGSQMQMVALNWHIYILTNSAIALGLIGLSRFLPIVVFSLVGGTFADAHNRKKIMLITQSTLTFLSAILALATFNHIINPFLIYSISVASAIALSFDTPSRQAFIPSLVERKHLANAMSLNSIMFQTSMIIGPSIAGVVIAKFGVGSVYSLNSLSFLAVIGALLKIKASGEIEGEPTDVSLGSIIEGIKFVKSKTIIWSTMLLDFFSTFFSSANALLPIFAKDILSVGPQGLGILYAAPSLGAVCAAFVMAHRGTIRKQGILILCAVASYGLATIVFGLSRIFFISFLALAIVGVGDSISTIIRNTVRQFATPDDMRGRMIAINMIFFMGGPQLGEFEAGLLAALIGAPFSVVIGGIATLIVIGVVSATIPTLRKYEVKIS